MALPDDGLVTRGVGVAGAETETVGICTDICDGNGVGLLVIAIDGGGTYAG